MNNNRLGRLSALSMAVLAVSAQATQYEVVELPLADQGKYSYAQAINNQGDSLSIVEHLFNPKFDISLLDLSEDSSLANALEDVEAVKAGNISNEDMKILYAYLMNSASSPFVQKLANYRGYYGNGDMQEGIAALDEYDPELDDLTGSANSISYGLNDNGIIVGQSQGATYKLDYTTEATDTAESQDLTYVLRPYRGRGFIRNDSLEIELPPVYDALGGVTEARGISNNGYIAGSTTVDLVAVNKTTIENCEDDEKRGDRPLEVCLNTISPTFESRAAVWQLTDEYNLSEPVVYGVLMDVPEETEETENRTYNSRALAVNSQGIAVGEAAQIDPRYDRDSILTQYAAIFKDGEVTGFTNQDDYYRSRATDINDSNLIVGYGVKNINGYERTKFFVHNMETNETLYPEDFFNGSSSTARAINNNGIVVGDGEIDTATGVTRRRHAFIYDYNEQSFNDVNDMLGCESPYTIVQANDINDNGVIAATALVSKIQLGIDGEPVLDDSGNEIAEDVIVSVNLIPVPGAAPGCEQEDEDKVQRKGGGIGAILLLLAGIIGLRRKGL